MADEAPQVLDVHDAGEAIGALFAPPPEKPARVRGEDGKFVSTKPKEPEPEGEEEEQESPYAEGEDAPKAKDGEEKEEAPEDQPADEEDEDGEDPAPPQPTFKVKVDGMEVEVPQDELVKGYSRTADYTRKTQALAEEKRRFETEELTPLREERRYYAEKVAALEEALEALAPAREPNWAEERNRLTPEQFAETFANWQANRQRMEKVQAEREAVLARAEQDEARRLQATLKAEQEKLYAALPEMADAEKGKALKDDLIAYAKSLQFTDDDIAQVTDHRVLVLLDKARRFDEAQRKKPTLTAKVDRLVETMKPSPAKPKPKVTALERAKGRLAVTKSVDDAGDAINVLLGGPK